MPVQAQEGANPTEQSECELKVWSNANFYGLNYQTNFIASQGGLLGAALTGRLDKSKEEIREIDNRRVSGVSGIIDRNFLSSEFVDTKIDFKGSARNSNVTFDDSGRESRVALKSKERAADKFGSCYLEIYLVDIGVTKDALLGTRLNSFTVILDYRNGAPKRSVHNSASKIEGGYPPASEADREAAREAIIRAAQTSFIAKVKAYLSKRS